MNKWDIYFAHVPFEDLPESKPRPVIVLDDLTVAVVCLKMTSHSPRLGEYSLKRWRDAGLMKPTTVRISKRLSLGRKQFIKRLGSLHRNRKNNAFIISLPLIGAAFILCG